MLGRLGPVIAPAQPPASASFVRPPPAFRLATTSLWVPTHSPDKHGFGAASDWGDGSGRSQRLARAMIDAERAAESALAVAPLSDTIGELSAAAIPSDHVPLHNDDGREAAADDRSSEQHYTEDGIDEDTQQAAGMATAASHDGDESEHATTAADLWTYHETPQVSRRTLAVTMAPPLCRRCRP